MKPDISKLTKFILSFEGGFVNDPNDLGGATNKGVTLNTWKTYGYDKTGNGKIDVLDLKKITDYDVMNRILKPHYWNICKADEINDEWIAYMLVDWYWCSGNKAITELLRLLNVKLDGLLGSVTLGKLNEQNPLELFLKLSNVRELFLIRIVKLRPANRKFLSGWTRRVHSIQYGLLKTNNNIIIK